MRGATPCAEAKNSSPPYGGGLARLRLALPDNPNRSVHTSVLEARGGADHVVLQPRTAMHWEQQPVCEVSLADSAFGNPVRLSMEAPEQAMGSWIFPEAAGTQHIMPERGYHSIPWTSLIHLDLDSRRPFPWESAHQRAIFVAAK
eukprot:266118-Prymnesium_polylepis.1